MSEYMFGVGHNKPTAADANKIDKIARKHGFVFVSTTLPGVGHQHWFAGPNRGNPFDGHAQKSICDDLQTAGLLDASDRIKAAK